eukprot:TRINITY_DN9730_c0_g1_i4.p1 TRINITY_DN9730_c0_g1~~TRINITY_DN9730_c0_g1_i4.p1  ORF type:complete len:113 (+),score=23.98 TRINITY_DN9730_c0_g1_i4:129-467(+)
MVKAKHPNQRLKLIAGFSIHKNVRENIRVVGEYANEVYFVECENLRASRASALYEIANQLPGNWNLIQNGNIDHTIRKVVGEGDENDVVMVCGSFYIMCDARKTLGYSDPSD